MSPTIDLTQSDDEVIFSQPRSKGKRPVVLDSSDEEDLETPTKRFQGTLGGFSLSASSKRPSQSILMDSEKNGTPTKRVQRGISGPSHQSSRGTHRGTFLSRQQSGDYTPSKSAATCFSRRQSADHTPTKSAAMNTHIPAPTTPPMLDDSETEGRDDSDFEESTRLDHEQAAYRRVAKQPPAGGYKLVEVAMHKHEVLQSGTNIELHDGDFFRIVHVFWDPSKGQGDIEAYVLRGILLRRNLKMGDMFPKKLNELVAIVAMPMEDQRPHLIAGLQDRQLTEFSRVREIRFTNADFPDFSFRDDQTRWLHVKDNATKVDNVLVFEQAHLVCRYKSVERWRANPKPKLHTKAFLILDPEETDPQYRMSNVQRMRSYFLKTRGRADGAPSEHTAIYGGLMDLYSGSGGASEAARLAGIDVAIAVDNKECAVHSHQHNHPQCCTFHSDVHDIINREDPLDYMIVEVCHSSCPCRFWSGLHTREGKNDDANVAAAYMVENAAKKSGCRIMTFEQTPGFSGISKHGPNWAMFINQFTSMGFDVVWGVSNLADTGNPQSRRRLWVTATCPGQKMPKDVLPTHGPPNSGLLPYVTVREAIANIPRTATMHNPRELEEKFRRTGKPVLPVAEWDKPLKHLIATSGPAALHPSGLRTFTVREALCLQGFPVEYTYVGKDGLPPSRTESMGMIGDAVPPKAAAPYFATIKEALRVTDVEVAAASKPGTINLDD